MSDQTLVDLYASDPSLWLGPSLIGFGIDALLLGTMLHLFQTFQTFTAPTEPRIIRALVLYLVLLSTGVSIYSLATGMKQYVYGFGDYAASVHFSNTLSPFFYTFDQLARGPVTAFYAERAWRITNRSLFFAVPLLTLLVGSLLGAIATTVLSVMGNDKAGLSLPSCYQETMTTAFFISLELTSDILTTGTIAWHLVRSRTDWKETNELITRLLVLVLETQLPPTIFAVVYLIVHYVAPPSYSYFFRCLPKVYVLCLLATLNAKTKLRAVYGSGGDVSTFQRGANTFALKTRRQAPQVPAQIEVYTETVTHVDGVLKAAQETPGSPRLAQTPSLAQKPGSKGREATDTDTESDYERGVSLKQILARDYA